MTNELRHAAAQEATTNIVAPRITQEPPPRRVRAAMIVNPYSSGMTAARERAIVTSLRKRLDVEVRRTERGGHAPLIAEQIISAGGTDVIISCGGDGTINEILNGLALSNDSAEDRPAVAVVPAGGTNVLARSLGFPNHPVRAMKGLVDAIADLRTRTVNLGTVDERIYTFSAGIGLDAEVVKRMELRRSGRRPSDLAHTVSIVGVFAASRFALDDSMTITVHPRAGQGQVTGDGAPPSEPEQLRAALLFVGNTTPMTYIGRVPVHYMPDCSLDEGIDFIAPQRASASFAMRNSLQAMGVGRSSRRLASDDTAQLRHDVGGLSVVCDEPLPVQADGEFLGDRTHVEFGLLERAIRLVI